MFLLLFAIGLEFSLDELWRMRRHVLLGGLSQMLLVAMPVASALLWFDMSWQSAMLISAATAFSSTVLVFKALSGWGHSSLPHGWRAISILLFQNAALIPLQLVVPLLTGNGEEVRFAPYAWLVAVSLLFAAIFFVSLGLLFEPSLLQSEPLFMLRLLVAFSA